MAKPPLGESGRADRDLGEPLRHESHAVDEDAESAENRDRKLEEIHFLSPFVRRTVYEKDMRI